MMPEMQQIKTKYICEQLKNTRLEKENKWLFRALMTVAALCMIGMFLVINKYEEKYHLGVEVVNSDICVEFEKGYACDTPYKVIFIEK